MRWIPEQLSGNIEGLLSQFRFVEQGADIVQLYIYLRSFAGTAVHSHKSQLLCIVILRH